MISDDHFTPRLSDAFQQTAPAHQQSKEKPSASPFSLRLTAGERAYLKSQAGSKPLGAYIRLLVALGLKAGGRQ